MKAKKLLIALSCISFILLIGTRPSRVICAERIVMNWASMLPKTSSETIDFQKMFVDKFNEKAKGEIVINYRGGPEVIGQFDLGAAVQKGVVDMAFVSVGFYEALAPGIGAAMLTQLTPQEERKPGGAYYYLDELHNKGGLKYLGRAAPSREPFFFTYLNKKVTMQKDFVGLRIGCATAARPASIAWGASVSPVKISEYYSAMERNLVDAIAGCPLEVWVSLAAHEVTKYVIDHPYYKSTAVTIMNLNSWNKLPKNLQNLLIETKAEFEKDIIPANERRREEARQKMINAKIEFYKFSPPIADWFISTAYKAAWDYQQSRFPEATAKLKELLTK